MFERFAGRYAKLCDEHPQSGPLLNLYAWTAAKCGHDLDRALDYARRAVALQPRSTACLDTLAETHFQRGEHVQAVTVMERCVSMEPDDLEHKTKLERFRKAAAAPGKPGVPRTPGE